MTTDGGEVPPEIHIAATYPIADVTLSGDEEERIDMVIRATWQAACQWWLQHTHGNGNGTHV